MMDQSESNTSEIIHRPDCRTSNWEKLSHNIDSHNNNILSINVRSLPGKFSELLTCLNTVKKRFTFIVLTEVWLHETDDYSFEIPGYKSVSIYREKQRGGGIKVYYLESVNIEVIKHMSGISTACESLFFTAKLPNNKQMILGAIYRPPQFNMSEFLSFLDSTLADIASKRSVIVGDFNIDILAPRNNTVLEYKNLYIQYGFKNEKDKPTYHSPIINADTSCLDHVLHNFTTPTKSFIIEPNFSDHYAICFEATDKIPKEPIRIKFRDYSQRNKIKFDENKLEELQNFHPPRCANGYAGYLTNFLYRILNKYFPVKTKTISSKLYESPWITPILLRCIRKKHSWYRFKKQGVITHESYRVYETKLRKLLRAAEQEYFIKRFDSLGNDPRKNWKTLNKLLGQSRKILPSTFKIDGGTTSNPEDISNHFGDYFINHPKNIHSSIPQSSSNFDDLIERQQNTMFLYPFNKEEVEATVKSLKKNGHIDDIPKKFMLWNSVFISEKLCELFNLCLEQGVFPEPFKQARVTPVHKKGPSDVFPNYRPISVLCNFAKIFECLLYGRLQSYFNGQSLLSEKQYGFRKGKNTELAILDLVYIENNTRLQRKKICHMLLFRL